MKLLFVMEQFCDADPKCGPTNSEHLVVNAVVETGLVREGKRFYFEQLSLRLGNEKVGELLIEDCEVFSPDVIIYTPLGGDLGNRLNPPKEVIRDLASRIKMFTIIWDAKPACGIESWWIPYVTYLGMPDCLGAFFYYKDMGDVIPMYSAVDPGSYYNKGLQRDIDVSFVGSVDPTDQRWPMRAECTNYLRENGIDIRVGGGQRVQRLSTEDYATIMNRSKISLNFCRDGNGLPVLKSRVFEITACGALIMEDRGTDTQKFFEENGDFVAFDTREELLDKVRYYLAHEEERAEIAYGGWHKATYVYNAANMWGYIFERMGLEIPPALANSTNYLLHKQAMEGL